MAAPSPTSFSKNLKEVRLGLFPTVPSSVIEIHLPSSAITFSLSSRPKRQILTETPSYKSLEDFSRYNAASASSIFFGHPKAYPRNFLWRLLEEDKVLELRSIDLSKGSNEEEEACHILRLRFSAAVRQGGLALTEGEDRRILHVFALTTSNELYTLDLRRAFFYDCSASEEEVSKWCTIFKPASTSFHTPHRFVAPDPRELLIGLSDGRILHLTRPSGSDGTLWHELACNDGQWGSSLRSLVRWQGSNTIRHGNAILDQDTVQTMAYSPDKKHLWMVCLNHTLKARNMKQGRTVYTTDLLGIAREPHEISKIMLDPGNPNMLQVFENSYATEGDQYYLMTYSPHDLGQFKIWAVRDANAGAKGIRDLYPEFTFRAPDPDPDPKSNTIWKVADFQVKLLEVQRVAYLHIWVLMRSNRLDKLYCLKCPSDQFTAALSDVWQDGWAVATTESISDEQQPYVTDDESKGVIDCWLDFLFQPGKYPPTVIQTALSIYAKSRKSTKRLDAKASLQQQIQSLVSSNVTLKKSDSGGMDFKGYRAALNDEFTDLWQSIRESECRRWDGASLSYDHERQIPWLAFADGCSPIRECSRIEAIAHSAQDLLPECQDRPKPRLEHSKSESMSDFESKVDRVLPDELAVLVAAAASFRKTFNHRLLQTWYSILQAELWREPSRDANLRIEEIYQECEFGTEISDDTVDRLRAHLSPIGGLDGLQNAQFTKIMKGLFHKMPKAPSGLQCTNFGLQAWVRATQEMVALSKQVLRDLLLLTIVIAFEGDWEETEENEFDGSILFVKIIDKLKKLQIISWLANNVRHEPTASLNRPDRETSEVRTQNKSSTVFEHLFAVDVSPRPVTNQSESVALTSTVLDVWAWVMGGSSEEVKLDDVIVRIQCSLLVHGNIDLASDFLHYQPANPWANYVKGRYYLLRNEFTEAAIHFEMASSKLARPGHHTDPATSEYLLSSLEAAHLGRGLTTYFTHIQDFYQVAGCPSYVATFANKILEQQLPPSQQIMPLTRLFHASKSTSDFETAFTVLTRLPIDNSSNLVPAFLDSLLAADEFKRVLDLPWPRQLLPHVERFLAQKASKPPTTNFYNPSAPQYNKLLAAWYMRRLDYRSAAAALLTHLQRVQKCKRASSWRTEDDEIISTYLSVINLLACCGGDDEAWVLTDTFDEMSSKPRGQKLDESKKKRKLVTIKDVRARYQKELDRRSMLENGQFAFGLDGIGDEDDEDAMDIEVSEEKP